MTRARLEAYFANEGYEVLAASNGEDMWRTLHSEPIDVVLLDVGLPGKDGLELARELRAHDERLGIILVTGRSDDIDKIVGLESGADDYVTKPFSPKELLARVRRAMRRSYQVAEAAAAASAAPASTAGQHDILAFDNIRIDFTSMVATCGQKSLTFTAQEFKLLKYFAASPSRVITREELLNEVWGYENYPTTRTVDNHVLRLRQKLEPDPSNPRYFLTMHGSGYKFVPGETSVTLDK